MELLFLQFNIVLLERDRDRGSREDFSQISIIYMLLVANLLICLCARDLIKEYGRLVLLGLQKYVHAVSFIILKKERKKDKKQSSFHCMKN